MNIHTQVMLVPLKAPSDPSGAGKTNIRWDNVFSFSIQEIGFSQKKSTKTQHFRVGFDTETN